MSTEDCENTIGIKRRKGGEEWTTCGWEMTRVTIWEAQAQFFSAGIRYTCRSGTDKRISAIYQCNLFNCTYSK